MRTYKTKDKQSSAENLLWRWAAHRAGEEAFEKSFPAQRCDDPLWKAMHTAVRNRNQQDTRPADGAFDFRTFTDRVDETAGHRPVEHALSPASLTLIKYAASGYAAPDIPKATLLAMNAWLSERKRLLMDFSKLFEDDNPWHPYQCCVRTAMSSLWKLEYALRDAVSGDAQASVPASASRQC
jgi:hypothetical protein